MTPDSIRSIQASLGLPQTGVFDSATSSAYSAAVQKSLSGNQNVQRYGAGNDPASILSAFQSGDWSGITSLTGQPFTPEQQQSAVAEATKTLDPAYKAATQYDTEGTQDTLQKNQDQLGDFETDQAKQFTKDKDTLDQSASDNGVLFSGARVQKNNDLRTTYETADMRARRNANEAANTAGRNYAYAYGDNNIPRSISDLYSLPGATSYNANVAHGAETPSTTLSAAYTPGPVTYQGTKPVAQQTAIQTRAAGLLANRANKMSLSGYATKF